MSDERGEMNEEQPLRDEPGTAPRTRRDLLKVAGAATAALAGAKLLSPGAAEANNGDPLAVGQTTTTSAKTLLQSSVSFGPHPANPLDGAFRVDAPNADYGIYGTGGAYGVAGFGPAGVLGLGTVGGVFAGSSVAINLDPQSTAGPPLLQAFKGDLAVDSDGVLWLCVVGSPEQSPPYTPGTFIKISHGGTRYLSTPVRIYDSRPGQLPATGPKTQLTVGDGTTGNPRTIQVTGGASGVPANAVGAFGTLHLTNITQNVFVGVWPSGPYPGNVNILSFANGLQSCAFSVGLNSNGNGTMLMASSGLTDIIIDIAGYTL